jgi:hypothetical protein
MEVQDIKMKKNRRKWCVFRPYFCAPICGDNGRHPNKNILKKTLNNKHVN